MFQAERTAYAKPRGGERASYSMGQEHWGNCIPWRRNETVLGKNLRQQGAGMSLGIQTGQGWLLSALDRRATGSERSQAMGSSYLRP